ncbi:lasso peptide biosynthesis B2 protein [Streptomyces sp. URMC 127]|uniref:lasso peptide biosynthesis B2 protein n=1 Tax=Streptomyces sp. URMC 127 TaxID=3423402 RepID=UPI003F1939D9
MSQAMVPADRDSLPLHRRLPALLAVTAARLLVRLKPHHLRRFLSLARRGATPATVEQALAARSAVVAVSARCAGEGCLQRSVATVLLCRTRGVWPDWCTGVRTAPFRAHAWVEVNGIPVGEPYPAGHYHRLMTVPVTPGSGPPRPGQL